MQDYTKLDSTEKLCIYLITIVKILCNKNEIDPFKYAFTIQSEDSEVIQKM